MSMRKSSYEYIIPAVLALALTLGLIHYVPALSTHYLLRVERTKEIKADYVRHYHDLDGDGTSEVIELFYNSSENLAVKIRHLSEATINQFNLPGRLVDGGTAIELYDINGDRHVDVFICSEKNDTMYLSIIDDAFSHPTSYKCFVLDPINQYNDNADYNYIPGGISDLNGDGHAEYVMAINGGHSLQPRRVYAIDYHKDTVLRSPISGTAIHSLTLFDLDGNGLDEVLVNTTATDNFDFPFPYMDTTAWLVVLTSKLDYCRPPVSLNDQPSFVELEPFTHEGVSFILAHQRYREGDKVYALFSIYDESYTVISERKMIRPRNRSVAFFRDSESPELEHLKLIIDDKVYTLDFDLSFVDSLSLEVPRGLNHRKISLDLDGNGDMEYIFPSNQDIVVLRSDLRQPALADINWNESDMRSRISVIKDGSGARLLFVHQDSEEAWLSYHFNGWVKYRVLVYPLIFILLYGLFYYSGYFQNRLIRKRYEKDRLISQLQLQSIKNQLDPHFTYNALNAVGSLIYKGEKDQAYQYLKGVTDLLRMVSGDASDVCWTLAEELDFVYKFMEIEKLRFREKFVYSIAEEAMLMEFKVPKLSVLTFVENALKHGLRHKVDDRKLEIELAALDGGLKIGIRDNGIGRKAAEKYREEKSGNGIKIMKKYFKQFNEASERKARFEITDLFNQEEKAAGTLVEIYII